MMDISFTREEESFRSEVREFLDAQLTEELREGTRGSLLSFAEPDIGLAWQRRLHGRGWAGYNWPEGHGGTGWSAIQRYIFEYECAHADAPVLPVAGLRLLGPVLHEFGTEDQKQFYLPRILSGEDYWCQGFSEPGSGSDLASLSTKAVPAGDHYSITGSKIWTTQAHFANRIFCLVRTDGTVRPQAGISFLMVDMQQEGLTISPILSLSGDHEVNQLFFDGVRAPISDRIGAEGQGWSIAKFLLEHERAGAVFAPKLLRDLTLVRENWPHAFKDEAMCKRHAQLELEARALELSELRSLARRARGLAPGPQASMFKMQASTLRKNVDFLAFQAAGDHGLQLATGRPLYGANAPEPIGSRADQVAAPRYLNSLAWTIFGGSNEIQMEIIGRTILGMGK